MSEGDVSFREESITQQKKSLSLQLLLDYKGMLSMLEPNIGTIFVLSIK
jgi:hypothetical protein